LQKKYFMAHKAGFVSIIGNPNVGKSTLMNSLVGEKLSIITSKAQTTRHRIMGIINGEDFQMIYSDTPGILTPAYKMQKAMMSFVETALEDSDVILYMAEAGETNLREDIAEKIKTSGNPYIIVINKIDKADEPTLEQTNDYFTSLFPGAELFFISALHKINITSVFKRLLEFLPESPAYFPKDQLTDKSERFFITEILREKILMNYHKEVPYSVEVVVDSFKEEEDIIRIMAIIYCSRESQKAIILGHKGNAIKKTASEARADMEAFLQKHVYLELTVKVSKDWRDSDLQLKRFGYFTE